VRAGQRVWVDGRPVTAGMLSGGDTAQAVGGPTGGGSAAGLAWCRSAPAGIGSPLPPERARLLDNSKKRGCAKDRLLLPPLWECSVFS